MKSKECERHDTESIEDKMHRCTHLALQVAYCELDPAGGFFTPRSIDDNEVWSWAEGLYQARFIRLMEGRCSLQASLDFDMEAEEQNIDRLIVKFSSLLGSLGEPITLTVDEMCRRGYRGYRHEAM